MVSVEEFAARPTRVLDFARETRTINSVTVGGDIGVIPRRAVTVGMKEILASRRLRFYCNRPWQRGVVRRVLHGPITPACPAIAVAAARRCGIDRGRLRRRAAGHSTEVIDDAT